MSVEFTRLIEKMPSVEMLSVTRRLAVIPNPPKPRFAWRNCELERRKSEGLALTQSLRRARRASIGETRKDGRGCCTYIDL